MERKTKSYILVSQGVGKPPLRYYFRGETSRKAEAEKEAKEIRKQGGLARITRCKGGYRIWFRKKER